MRLIVPFRAVLRWVDVGDAEEPRRHANRRQHQRHQHSGDDDAHRPAQADASVRFRCAVVRQRMLKSCAGCIRHVSVGELELLAKLLFGHCGYASFLILGCDSRECFLYCVAQGGAPVGATRGQWITCSLLLAFFPVAWGFPISLDAAFNGLVGENQKKRKRAKMPRFPLIEQISRRF